MVPAAVDVVESTTSWLCNFQSFKKCGVVEGPCQNPPLLVLMPLPHRPDLWNCCCCRSSYSNRLPTTSTAIASSIGIIISRICSHDCQNIVNFSLDNFGRIARILLQLLLCSKWLFLLNNDGCSRCRWSRRSCCCSLLRNIIIGWQ